MRKAKKISVTIFWFVFLSIIAAVSSQQCIDTDVFDANSNYGPNRQKILSYLLSNVTARKDFYNASIGQDSDKVYAMGMCINGSEQAVCSECIEIAVEQLKYNCLNQTQAFTWTPHKTLCFARYSNVSFFERHDKHPLYSEHSNVDIISYLAYSNTWRESMNEMKDKAQDRNGSFYDKVGLKDHMALYRIMQCTPNLSPTACGECLGDCVSFHEGPDFKGRGSKAGIIAYPSCYFQWDLYPFIEAFNSLPTPPPGCTECKKIKPGMILAAVAVISTAVIAFVLSVAVVVYVCRRRKTDPLEEISTTSSLQYDLKTIEAATCTFSRRNILGKGGFGEVFKGVLQNGSAIAAKRLSKESAQGVQEFKNEISLVAKLQHKNLVGVLGFCVEGEEKILIYEFVPNKSLDHFLFDPTKQGELDWAKRYKIIVGTAKGIQYLHHDSPLTIIHRDLKASNILLDAEMKPKVADFGMARILEMDQTRADTRRVVGTHGYISPEYMMHGQFSMKSDVYSFGVLVLEIISGKRNSNFHENDNSSGKNLVMHAWKHWRNGSPLVLVDAKMGTNYQSREIIRCIHIALLCVQNVPEKRPYISGIISMLTSDSTSLPVPESPVYRGSDVGLPTITSVPVSTNDSLINDLVPR